MNLHTFPLILSCLDIWIAQSKTENKPKIKRYCRNCQLIFMFLWNSEANFWGLKYLEHFNGFDQLEFIKRKIPSLPIQIALPLSTLNETTDIIRTNFHWIHHSQRSPLIQSQAICHLAILITFENNRIFYSNRQLNVAQQADDVVPNHCKLSFASNYSHLNLPCHVINIEIN